MCGLGIGVVANDPDRVLTQLFGRGVEGLLAAAGEYDARSLGDEEVSGGAAEAATAAGDDIDTFRELQVPAPS